LKNFFTKNLFTEVEIHSSRSVVWKVMTDFPEYGLWNPFIPMAQGELKEGAMLNIQIAPPGKRPGPYVVRIMKLIPNKELHWEGRMFFKWILTGKHNLEIQLIDEKNVRLIHSEEFSGILVPFVWRGFLNTVFRRGFEDMNQSLKLQAEKGSHAS
jgi:hypothetical protein